MIVPPDEIPARSGHSEPPEYGGVPSKPPPQLQKESQYAGSKTLLTSLVQTTIDSAEGYEHAAEQVKAPGLKQVLRDQAAKRRQLVADLNAELVRLGGERQERGSTSGAAHQVWTRISTFPPNKAISPPGAAAHS